MTIEARLADGRILKFPDGTDPNIIQATVRKMVQAPTEQAQPVAQAPPAISQPRSRSPFSLGPANPAAFGAFIGERAEQAVFEGGERKLDIEARENLERFEAGEISSKDLTAEQIDRLQKVRREALPELRGITAGVEEGAGLGMAAALLTALNPDEFEKILTTIPEIGVAMTPEGVKIAVNNKTGATAILNKPGISSIDVLQGLGVAAAFFPAARGASLLTSGSGLTARTAAQAAGAGLTETAIQSGQAAAGGEFDTGDIALATGLGAAAEFVPGAGKSIRDFIRATPEGEAAQLLATGQREGVPVLTSDVVPPETFFGKSIQQLGEKIGILGTGPQRAAQQKARQETVQALADEFGIVTVNDDFLPQIVQSLTKKQAAELEKAGIQRNEAVERLLPFGLVPTPATKKAIDREVAKQARLGEKGNTELVSNLDAIKESIDGDFSLVKDIRTEVISDLKALSRADDRRGEAALQSVKSAIDKDLIVFARKNDRGALKKWLTSNRKFAFELNKSRNTELKRLIQSGEASPKVVAPILRGGDPTELKRLNTSLTPRGQAAARSAIIKDAMESSGFFTSANPDKLATVLGKPRTKRAINAFFNEEQKQQLDGLTRLLDATRRAQQAAVSTPTGQQAIPAVVGIGAIAEPFTAFLVGSSLLAVTRGYESKAVRSVLLKLAATKAGSKAESELIKQLQPLITSSIQSVRAGEQ